MLTIFNTQKVKEFLNDMLIKAKPFAQKEFDELAQFAKDLDGKTDLQKWDSAFYAEKLKKKLFNLDLILIIQLLMLTLKILQ